MIAYLALLAATAAERIVELVLSTRHARAAFARGGIEYGRGHFPALVALHVGLLLGCAAEVLLAHRPSCRGWAGRCCSSCC